MPTSASQTSEERHPLHREIPVETKTDAQRPSAFAETSVTEASASSVHADPAFAADARARAAKASAFDMTHVLARYRREEGFPGDVVADHRRELDRFLALSGAALAEGRVYGMMGAIDELWHTFVIFTREYARFCDEVCGRFLHHVPEVEGEEGGSIEHYLAFLADYEAVFGEAPPAEYWPRPSIAAISDSTACKGCKSCSGCGSGGSCTVH